MALTAAMSKLLTVLNAGQVESTVESTNPEARKMTIRRLLSERSGTSIDAPLI